MRRDDPTVRATGSDPDDPGGLRPDNPRLYLLSCPDRSPLGNQPKACLPPCRTSGRTSNRPSRSPGGLCLGTLHTTCSFPTCPPPLALFPPRIVRRIDLVLQLGTDRIGSRLAGSVFDRTLVASAFGDSRTQTSQSTVGNAFLGSDRMAWDRNADPSFPVEPNRSLVALAGQPPPCSRLSGFCLPHRMGILAMPRPTGDQSRGAIAGERRSKSE